MFGVSINLIIVHWNFFPCVLVFLCVNFKNLDFVCIMLLLHNYVFWNFCVFIFLGLIVFMNNVIFVYSCTLNFAPVFMLWCSCKLCVFVILFFCHSLVFRYVALC